VLQTLLALYYQLTGQRGRTPEEPEVPMRIIEVPSPLYRHPPSLQLVPDTHPKG
jgi:hypothetical protein